MTPSQPSKIRTMRGARNNRNQWAEGKAAIEWFHGIGRLDGDGSISALASLVVPASRKGKVDKGQIVA